MNKKLISTLIILKLLTTLSFSYETLKTTKIVNDPTEYEGKRVLVYIKFDKIKQEGVLGDFLVKGLDYHYDTKNEKIKKTLKDLKQRDFLTVKGEVKLIGFIPYIQVHGLVKGWIDTTLLPESPNEIEIICPNCNETIIYDFKEKKAELKTLGE